MLGLQEKVELWSEAVLEVKAKEAIYKLLAESKCVDIILYCQYHNHASYIKGTLLRFYASPDPPATSSAHVYRVHDHSQTQVDRGVPQDVLLPHLSATTDRTRAGNHATKFPIRITFVMSQDYQTLQLIIEEGNLLDPSYKPQPAHSHRQHSPTRATTQEFLMFIRHPEQQLKRCYSEPQLKRCYSEPQLKEYHVLNPYPEPQLKGYVSSVTIHYYPNSEKVKVSGPTVIAPEDSPNTNGIHVTKTQNIQISDSVIRTGDDRISVVHGSKNVEATNITRGSGHGLLQGDLLPYLSATTDRARAGKHATDPTPQRQTTKLVSQQLRRAISLDPSVLATTSTLTPATLANPSHNSRVPSVHPPSRATTQEMLFRATTQGIPPSPAPPASSPAHVYRVHDHRQIQADRPHRLHLHHHLLTCIAYTIIAKYKQIGKHKEKRSHDHPLSAAKPHQLHLHHHLLTCIAYTIIAKYKQIGTTTGTRNDQSTNNFKISLDSKPPSTNEDSTHESTRGIAKMISQLQKRIATEEKRRAEKTLTKIPFKAAREDAGR
ncbi:polygalacturonase [Vigna unguiculata]|uniref:Polygalacturonase n=1 Tax=Vigna unguiculata TaxID=3917 RepID=A0A4D6KQ87_VIGUN|nr:polygalacturonase [Vigna unguiculata]